MERKIINGMDIEELRAYQAEVLKDHYQAERNPTLVANWVGGSRARVQKDGIVTHIGGDSELDAMQTLLACLVACDVEVIVMHAAFKGLEIKSLSIEATGHFNIARFMGAEGAPGPGYDRISYKVRINAPGATPEQIAYLQKVCEHTSPVGDSLAKAIPLKLEFESV